MNSSSGAFAAREVQSRHLRMDLPVLERQIKGFCEHFSAGGSCSSHPMRLTAQCGLDGMKNNVAVEYVDTATSRHL
ncbi:hypothetical protein AB1N83_007182 [Pleurotus pulmonarius]